jgi:hypothetical protein
VSFGEQISESPVYITFKNIFLEHYNCCLLEVYLVLWVCIASVNVKVAILTRREHYTMVETQNDSLLLKTYLNICIKYQTFRGNFLNKFC